MLAGMEDHPPTMSTEPSGQAGTVRDGIRCIRCAYSLRGLSTTGACPECALPVAVSLEAVESGFLVEKSSPQYVRTLLSGTRFVLFGILIQIVLLVVGVLLGMAVGSIAITYAFEGLGFLVSVAIAFGLWRLTEPDPALLQEFDGGTPRRLVRVCIVIEIVTALLSLVVGGLLNTGLGGSLGAAASGLVLLASWFINLAAAVTAFFAQMLYIRWLAPRLPNQAVFKRAKTLMWLGPVLYTVGLLLLGLGPLIALILYWNMLDKVRKDLKGIVAGAGNGFPSAV